MFGIKNITKLFSSRVASVISKYATNVLSLFEISNRKPVKTPIYVSPCKTGVSDPSIDAKLCRQASRSFIYLMMETRPDLAFVVGRLLQYM